MSMRITNPMQSKVAHSQISNLFTRKNIMTATTPSPAYDVQLSYESKTKFHDDVLKAQEEFQLQMKDISGDQFDEHDYGDFIDEFRNEFGDEYLAFTISMARWDNAHPDKANPMHEDAKKEFAKYEDAVKIIQKGDADTFLKYNLDFAALAAKGIEESNRDGLKAQIGTGRYTEEGYIKAKNYAQELESEANVFVRVGFVSRWNDVHMYNGLRQDYFGSLKFAYEGLLVSADVNVLDFMADHEEGKSIWIKVAQGAYKNHAEIEQALKDAGLADTAKAYENDLMKLYYKPDRERNWDFDHKEGSLWEAVLSPAATGTGIDIAGKAYQALRNTIFGDTKNILPQYTQADLEKAMQGAEKDLKFIKNKNKWRAPKRLIVNADQFNQKLVPKRDLLQEMLQSLQQQLTNVKSSRMPTRQKEAMMENLQEKITTVKERILKRKAEEKAEA